MKKDDIKDNVDKMILQVCKYIKAADLSDEDDFAIKIESGLSILTSAINFPDEIKNEEDINNIVNQISEISFAVMSGLTAASKLYKSGNIDKDCLLWL